MAKADVVADVILFPIRLIGIVVALGLVGAFLALVGFGLNFLWNLV